ncbi:hypothetical protein [Actinoallomurus sp. CA-150999]|uniref:hypothetical protein n=1 Tax=Actinoallomurus sp. CA-150999 TaxID=3239887 RepID=UPI003D8DDF2A
MDELKTIRSTGLPTFLRRWYGPPDQDAIEIDEAISMPDPLRAWYHLTSQWSTPMSRHNRFSSLDGLSHDGGMLIFWHENQGAASWATEAAGSDPLVYESEVDEDGDWESTGFTLTKFLLYVAVSEAVHGNPQVAVNFDLSRQEYEGLESHFCSLDDPVWNYPNPNWRYMAAENLVAEGGSESPVYDEPERYWIMVSTNDPKALRRLPQHLLE